MKRSINEDQLRKIEILCIAVVVVCILLPTWDFIRMSLSELVREWLSANWFAGGLNILKSQGLLSTIVTW